MNFLKNINKGYELSYIDIHDENLLRHSRKSNRLSNNKLDNELDNISKLIVEELIELSYVYNSDQDKIIKEKEVYGPMVYPEMLDKIRKNKRPMLTGYYCIKDLNSNTYETLLEYYNIFKERGDIQFYHRFRHGLDILDLDLETYNMLSMNVNSLGYYLPRIIKSVNKYKFFKIPNTYIIKVPLSLMQTIRCIQYEELNNTTLNIINEYINKLLKLDINKDFFIKTGTFSSKFDFRNARVTKGQEVKEIGMYLYFIQNQAINLASYLNNKIVYGVSTTNDFVVREYIDDVENNPVIYKGLPLRTEFRIFVDFDDKCILGSSPYWREDVMEERFKNNINNIHDKHDYINYLANKDKLRNEYKENVIKVEDEINKIICDCNNIKGQWSIDIMKNGKDFYLIDMAQAKSSALSDCVPNGLLKNNEENWLPES